VIYKIREISVLEHIKAKYVWEEQTEITKNVHLWQIVETQKLVSLDAKKTHAI
jgi:hypothetical protein